MDIAEWLRGLGLEKYAPAFDENAINWDVLSELTTDADAPLFRFMLISQHDQLPRLTREQRTAVDAVADTVTAAVQAGEIAAVDGAAAAAVIIGIVLQTAIFHIYGTLSGGLTERAPALACAAIAAVTALAEPPR